MDEPTDVASADITPDDFMADEQESPKAAPSTAKEEPKEPPEEKPVADKEPEAAPSVAETKETETDKVEKPDETETEKPLKGLDKRTDKLNTEIRDLVAQRNALRTEVEKANAEVYQPATETELVDQGMSEIEAKVEAMRQEREMEKFNTRVAEAQLTIGHESTRVLQDFPIFNPDSDSFDKELAEEAAALLDANLIRDENSGQVIGSNVSPYQLYKTIARASNASTVKGQMQGQKDTETMLANADGASGTSPPAKKVDPLTALWEEEL